MSGSPLAGSSSIGAFVVARLPRIVFGHGRIAELPALVTGFGGRALLVPTFAPFMSLTSTVAIVFCLLDPYSGTSSR